jgi:hypothetical protein
VGPSVKRKSPANFSSFAPGTTTPSAAFDENGINQRQTKVRMNSARLGEGMSTIYSSCRV